MDKETRCGFVALIGCTNVGKSTFLNAFVQEKIAIVSPKIHSTRFAVTGIVTFNQSQIIFIDTPGIGGGKKAIISPKKSWGQAVSQADIILFMVDARRGITDDVKAIAQRLAHFDKPIWLIFNKIDLIERHQLLPLTQQMLDYCQPDEVFMISARKRDGFDQLRDDLSRSLPVAPWFYPQDMITDQPERIFVAEMIREEILLRLQNEIPYNVTVQIDSFKTQKDGSIRCDAAIMVPKLRYKSVVIGKNGQKIRDIGSKARRTLEKAYDCRCHLFLQVRVQHIQGK